MIGHLDVTEFVDHNVIDHRRRELHNSVGAGGLSDLTSATEKRCDNQRLASVHMF